MIEPTADSAVEPPYVVCLGASAGGLEALKEFFRSLPENPGVPFVIVVHLSPDFKSLLPELLTTQTALSVKAAEDNSALERNHVYIIPPGQNMILEGGRLRLHAQDRSPGHGLHLPIDLFLNSLGGEAGRSIAVILSGTGSDGSRGIRTVKEAGGIVLAQSPESARFNGMPLSAVQTGLVDAQGEPHQLAQQVADLVTRELPPPLFAEGLDDDEQSDYRMILDLVKRSTGTNMSFLRPRMLGRRVRRRMAISGVASLSDYNELLLGDQEEIKKLAEDLLIGVTEFFRDKDAYDELKSKALSKLVMGGKLDDPLRIWVTACSSGQEVYSVGMLVLEAMATAGIDRETQIFATDLDVRALERASQGVYSMSEVAEIPAPLLRRYFEQRGSSYVVRPDLRSRIIFARHDIVCDPPFTRMDLVTCRNLLIYLRPDAQERALGTLLTALKPDTGILFLGAPENPGAVESALTCLSSRSKIFRRSGDVPRMLPQFPGRNEPLPVIAAPPRQSADRTPRSQLTLMRQVLETVFESEGQSAALIDEEGRLANVLTDPLGVFKLPKGQPTTDLSRILPGEILSAIRAGQQQLRAEGGKASFVAPRIGGTGQEDWTIQMFSLSRSPRGSMDSENTLLVLRSHTWEDKSAPPTQIDATSLERVERLELELRQTKESLQATIEELQSSAEEQQSTNEELIAANEELQSTNEELHSVNEELYTVNTEYQSKNLELQVLSADLDNLMNSTGMATLFLDDELRIRKFTQSIGRVIPLQFSDVGLPLSSVAFDVDREFIELFEEVRNSGLIREREMRDRQGAWMMMRVFPYKKSDMARSGVLATFVDITRTKHAEVTSRVMSAHLVSVNRRLTSRAEHLETLLSNLVRDLRKPLGGISTALDTLRGGEGQSQERVDAVAHASDDLEHLVKVWGALDSLGEGQPAATLVDLRQWFEQLIRPFAERADREGIQFNWVCDRGALRFVSQAFETALNQVVENALLHGATDAEPRIDVACQVEGKNLRLTVIDNGKGLDPNVARQVAAFARGDSENPAEEGPGVGLFVVQQLIERAGGTLNWESDTQSGTKFTVEVPLVQEESPDPKEKKVLLVEDDAVDAKLVKRLLPGYNVRWVRSLSEAIEAVDTTYYSLVLLDLSLPDGHGLKLTNSLGKWKRETPVIILSGQTRGLMEDTLEGVHVAGTFTKGKFDQTEFAKTVVRALK